MHRADNVWPPIQTHDTPSQIAVYPRPGAAHTHTRTHARAPRTRTSVHMPMHIMPVHIYPYTCFYMLRPLYAGAGICVERMGDVDCKLRSKPNLKKNRPKKTPLRQVKASGIAASAWWRRPAIAAIAWWRRPAIAAIAWWWRPSDKTCRACVYTCMRPHV